MLRIFHKSRKYPILRDEYGRSARRVMHLNVSYILEHFLPRRGQ